MPADETSGSAFEKLFRFSPLGLVISSEEGRVVDVNDAATRLLGFTRESMIGSTSAALGLIATEAHERAFASLRTEGFIRNAELTVTTRSGEARDVIVSIEPVDLGGNQRRYITTFLDITERRSVERNLRAAEERFRLVVESVKDYAIYMMDAEGRVQSWNAGAEKIKGYTDAEILGKSFAAFFPKDDAERGKPAALLKAAVDTGQTEDEGWRVRKDGSRFWANVTITAIRDASGGLRGFAKVTRDLTERRAAQARLILADRLSSVGTLAAGVAHEINNPLAYVVANLELIGEELRAISGGSPAGRMKDMEEMINEARQGTDRVRRIVRGLKTFSRADEDHRGPVDLRSVLDLSINMAFNEIRHRARLVKDYGSVPLVEADEARLGQVFINLLVNAAQALPEGQVDQHEIRVVTLTDGAGRAVIQVRDTGSGIAKDALPKIFDPFFTTKKIGEGTGLGLAICFTIVSDLGGEITAANQSDKGAIFQVVLPAAPTGPALSPTKALRSIRPLPARRGRVLVVDDDVIVGKAVRRVLSGDHDVILSTSGRQALDRIEDGGGFDVILCDLMMAEISGMDLYAELARTRPDQADRMVFITGGAFTPAARAFLDDVPNERLEKPFDPRNLRALVLRFLQ